MVNEIIKIVKECGEIILSANRESMNIDEKSCSADFVTEYDKKVQDALFFRLESLFPDAAFIGEEGEKTKLPEKGIAFIIDPIDGTMNFIKDYRMSVISVGVLKDKEPYIGVVYNPYSNEMFYAKKGEGAFLNGKSIHVSSEPLSNALVIFGTSPYYKEELGEATFRKAYELFLKASDIRRSGTAALDLCALAAGRAEIFFEMRLCPWDYAAAAVIVSEAGGKITDMEGKPLCFDKNCSVYASNF